MKRLLLGILFVVSIGVLSAQNNNPDAAIVKLKSGIEVRGVILELVENVSVTIKTDEGDIFVYRISEVSQIERPNAVSPRVEQRQKEAQLKLEVKTAKKEMREKRALGNFKGYRGIIDVSVGYSDGFGWADNTTPNNNYYKPLYGVQTKFSFINGYNAGPGFYVGVGVGVSCYFNTDRQYYGSLNDKAYGIPLFLHLRTSWAKNCKVSPFLSLSVGYHLDISGTPICIEHQCLPYSSDWCSGSCNPYVYSTSSYSFEEQCTYRMTKMNKLFVEPSFGLEFRTSRKRAVIVAFTVPMDFMFGDLQYVSFPLGANIGFSF